MTKSNALLIRSFTSFMSIIVLVSLGGIKPVYSAAPRMNVAQPGCESAMATAQRFEFYEGLAVLAKSNLEKFFIPQYRLAVHAKILNESGDRATFPQSAWWIPENPTGVYTLEPAAESPTEIEMEQIMMFRHTDRAQMTEEQLSTHLALEKKLHLALYQIHQEGLVAYREWAFSAFPPLRAYQRVFENYLSSSVWWNNYVSEYASTLAGIYREQNLRTGCPPEMLWTSLAN